MKDIKIETPRLLLRRITPEDCYEAFGWGGDPRVNKFMIYPLYEKAEDMRGFFESLDPESETVFEFIFISKQTGNAVGAGGIRYIEEGGLWTFGYNLKYDEWNKGYATEATKAMMEFVKERYGARIFEAEFAAENPASGRVMEKCGLTFHRSASYTKRGTDIVFPAKIYRLEL